MFNIMFNYNGNLFTSIEKYSYLSGLYKDLMVYKRHAVIRIWMHAWMSANNTLL